MCRAFRVRKVHPLSVYTVVPITSMIILVVCTSEGEDVGRRGNSHTMERCEGFGVFEQEKSLMAGRMVCPWL